MASSSRTHGERGASRRRYLQGHLPSRRNQDRVLRLGHFPEGSIWGEGTDEFRPGRWIEASPERLKQMDGTLDLIFGYGRGQCLGRNVAHMELKKIFVEVRSSSCHEGTFSDVRYYVATEAI